MASSPIEAGALRGDGPSLAQENAELRVRLAELEETLAAIRNGEVDALVVGSDIYTLDSSNAAANKIRQDVLAQMEDAVLAFDLEDHLVFMNGAAERHYRQRASESLGCAKGVLFEEIWPEGDLQRAAGARALRETGVFRGVLVHRLPGDGSRCHVETTVSLLRDGAGQPAGELHVIRDITERVRAEQSLAVAATRLAQRERQFSTLVENSPDIFARIDRHFRHVYVSPVVERYTGLAPGGFIGKTNAELGMPADLCARWSEALRRVFDTGQVGQVQFAFDAFDGREYVFNARLVPEFDDHGVVEHVLSVAVDVTAQQKINDALVDSQQRLQEADTRKDEFLATLAHELRNPLAPIRNALEIMRLSPRPEVQANARRIVDRQLVQMVHLVDDLLDVSRISRGKLELRLELADVVDVVQSAVETSRPLIEAGRHALSVRLPLQRTLMVEADATRLCQVVSNLLNNAAKYTPDGGKIDVAAERRDDRVVLTVSDSGIGIPPDMLPRVFDLFTQVERSAGLAQGGLGIGLALVKQLVEMHGGEVQARSEGDDRGAVFTVSLPLAAGAGEPSRHDGDANTPAAAVAGCKVLVVDDNIDSAETMAQVLDIVGYETAKAHDGREALVVAAEFEPDVAILDIGLPYLSGHDVARELRARPGGGDVLLIALSGWGQDADKRRSDDAGFHHHFIKPVDLDELLRVVADATRKA